MSDALSPRAKSLVVAGRADSPTSDERARIKGSVLARIGVGAAVISTTSAATGTAGVSKIGAAVAIALGVAVSGTAAVGILASRAHVAVSARSAPQVVAASPANAESPSVVPTDEPVSAPPSPSIEQNASTGPTHARALPRPAVLTSRPVPSHTAEPSTVEAELPLLRQAQEALREGNAGRALMLLGDEAKRFPNGALSEERAALHALASCKLGDHAGRAEADAFLKSNPTSPLSDRVREACADVR